ncbi:MAG: nitroreductase [Mycobacterium sp.]|nr:nitroreductase [Mycobacterium sp.]
METWEAIRARRNVRTYTADPVPKELLDRIVEAGWRAPRPPTGSTGTSSSSPTASS